MKNLFIIIAVMLGALAGCTIHDRAYYTVYAPVIPLTNSSPAVPPASVYTPRPQTNNVSSTDFPETSDHPTAGIAANGPL